MKARIIIPIVIAVLILLPLISATITILRPNGSGTYGQWTCSSHTGSVLSDDSNTTYCSIVTSVTANETNAMGDLPANAYSINNVTSRGVVWSQGGAGAEKGRIMTISGGVEFLGTSANLNRATPTNMDVVYATDPNGGAAWTVARVNGMEVGGRAGTLGTGETMNISETYAIVDYIEDTTPPSWNSPATNQSIIQQNDYINFTTWLEDTQLGVAGYIFSINQTGTWINSSYIASTTPVNASNVTKITAVAGTTVEWIFYANDTGSNMNNTMTKQTFLVASADTCTYSGSGNWALNCADNCIFATTQTIADNNNITITGTGTLTFNNGGKWSFSGTNQYLTIASGCTLDINTGGGWDY